MVEYEKIVKRQLRECVYIIIPIVFLIGLALGGITALLINMSALKAEKERIAQEYAGEYREG